MEKKEKQQDWREAVAYFIIVAVAAGVIVLLYAASEPIHGKPWGVAVLGGAMDPQKLTKDVELLGKHSRIHHIPSLPVTLVHHSTATFNQHIVTCGGVEDETETVSNTSTASMRSTASCWKWRRGKTMWMPAPALPESISSGAMSKLGHILVMTGGDVSGMGTSGNTWILGGLREEWTPGPKLTTPREGHCSTSYKSKVVVTGGTSSGQTLSSVEGITMHQTITQMPDMNTPRMAHGCVAITKSDGEEVMLVAGGISGSGSEGLRTVEKLEKGRWTTLTTNLPKGRIAFPMVSDPWTRHIYILSGYDEEKTRFTTTLVSSDVGGSWREDEEYGLKTGRSFHTAVLFVDNTWLAIDGFTD